MMYRVIKQFVDSQTDYLYNVGDKFPYDCKDVKEKRIEELLGKNEFGVPFIEAVVEKKTEAVTIEEPAKVAKKPASKTKTKAKE